MPKKDNLINQRFGKLRVVRFSHSNGRRTFWLCQCDCGGEKVAQQDVLKGGFVQSCGCLLRDDLTGQRFGRLRVLEYVGPDKHKNATWKCQCDCGQTSVVLAGSLRRGNTKSCGCLSSEKTKSRMLKHGFTPRKNKAPVYRSWTTMIQRCTNPNNTNYHHYGGRGIMVCDRWRKFEKFLEDMGDRPEGMTLDRYPNNNGNYEPGNCRWATKKEQSANQRPHSPRKKQKRPYNATLVWSGEGFVSLPEFADQCGVDKTTLYRRYNKIKNMFMMDDLGGL